MGSGDEPALEPPRETAAQSGVNGRREDSADSRGCSGAAGEPEGGRKPRLSMRVVPPVFRSLAGSGDRRFSRWQ